MPKKRESAESARNGVAKNQEIGSGNGNESANNAISDLIEHIEDVLASVDFAGVSEAALADMRPCPAVVPIRQCHASVSYVRKHQALSINLFWSGALPAFCRDADEDIERLRQQEAAQI